MDLKAHFKSVGKWVTWGIAALLLASSVLFVILQTGAGKQCLAQCLALKLSRGAEYQVKLGRFSGLVPFDFQLDSVTASDRYGEWMFIENIVLRCSLGALIRGKLRIQELSANAVRIERLPTAIKEPEKGRTARPLWPPAIPFFIMESFSVEQLSLGETVIGERVVYAINAGIGVEDSKPGLAGFLRIKRIDGPGTLADLAWSLNGKTTVLTLNARVKETDGFLVSRLFGLKSAIPIEVELIGVAPVKSWRGRLSAKSEKLGAVEALIGWDLEDDGIGLTGNGRVSILPGLASPITDALVRGSDCRFMLDVNYGSKKQLQVRRFRFETDWASMEYRGQIDFKKQTLRGAIALAAEDISSLGIFTGTKTAGRLTVHGNLLGPLRKPQITLSAAIEEPTIGDFSATRIDGEFRLEPVEQSASFFTGLIIQGQGGVSGLEYLSINAIVPEKQFQWALAAEALDDGAIAINQLDLSGQNTRIRLSGKLNLARPSFKGDAVVEIRDLKKIPGFREAGISGATSFQAQIKGDRESGFISAMVKGKINDLSSFFPLLNVLGGAGLEYLGKIRLEDTGRLSISDLQMKSFAANLAAEAAMDITTGNGQVRAHIDIPQLAVISAVLGQPLQGSLGVDINMNSELWSFKLTAKATGHDLLLGDYTFPQATVLVCAETLPSRPQGNIQVDLTQGGQTMHAMSNFLLDSCRLEFSEISMAFAGTQVTGNVNIHLPTMVAEGSLRGHSDDLRPVSFFWGESIGGRADFEAVLLKGQKGQGMLFDLHGKGLVTRFGNAREFVLKAQLEDIFHTLTGSAEARISYFQKSKLHLQDLRVKAESQPPKIAFSVNAIGQFQEDFEVRTAGSVVFIPEGDQLQLDTLQGQLGKYPFQLSRPLIARRVSGEYILERVALNLDTGSFKTSGKFGADVLALDFCLEDIPLGILNAVGASNLAGSLTARIQMSGKPGQPEAHIETRIIKARLIDTPVQKFPEVDLLAHADYSESLFRAVISVEGMTGKPITGSLKIPADISLTPFLFSLNPAENFECTLSAEVRLAFLAALLGFDEHRLDGVMVTDFSGTGSLQSPEFNGSIVVSEGAYENTTTGTILKNVRISARLSGDRLVLEKVQASDGEKGKISALGWTRFDPARNFPFQVDLVIDNTNVLRSDDLKVLAGGNLSFSGSLKQVFLSGQLTVNEAEYRLDESLPPEIPEMNVVEINSPESGPQILPGQNFQKEYADDWGLDLTVKAPGKVFIRGLGLDSEWRGGLRIAGQMQDPEITGSLSAVRGYYTFFGSRFAVTRGVISWEDVVPPPQIYISAENHRSDLTARFQLSGTPSNLKIALTSDPDLPTDEIISHLLFGRSSSNITPLQALRLVQAINMFSGGISMFDFLGRSRKLINLDQMDLRLSDENGKNASSVSAGKYLHEDVYIEVEKGIDTDTGKVSVEIELNPNITVETEAGADANSGIGVNWKLDY